jgi:hypothetical protein
MKDDWCRDDAPAVAPAGKQLSEIVAKGLAVNIVANAGYNSVWASVSAKAISRDR